MGASNTIRYTVVAVVGPDGVGKTSLVQALGASVRPVITSRS